MAAGAVRVAGLRELQSDFRKISRDLNKELRAELIDAADPVKVRAESLALAKIRNMPSSPHWAGMRIGVSAAKASVFMVPQARARGRRGGARPNLKNLLLDRAMGPALEEKQNEVVEGVGQMLDNLAGANGF
jgi:hypothetical protein